jgi:hypothetical protein
MATSRTRRRAVPAVVGMVAALRCLRMRKGETVRCYPMAMGTDVDLHTPHWHANGVTTGGPMGMHTDVVWLLPGGMIQADMKPDDPARGSFTTT